MSYIDELFPRHHTDGIVSAKIFETACAEVDSLRARLAVADAALAETRAKRDEYDDGQAHWFNEHFKLRVERDALSAENAALREALKLAIATIRTWSEIPSRGTKAMNEEIWALYQSSPEMVQINAALHPATKEGKAE